MKSLLSFLVISTSIYAVAGAQTLAVPEFHQRVIDQSGTLSRDQIQTLETKLAEFELSTSNQVVVLVIPLLQGESIEEYSLRVATKNKFGKMGRNNGILLVIAKDDRRVRIEVGYGLEGTLPDAVADQIIRQVIVPRFHEGDYFGGVSAGLDAIMAATKGEYTGDRKKDATRGFGFVPIVFLFLIPLFLLVVLRNRRHYIGRRGYYSGGPWWGGGGGLGGFSGGGGGFSGGGGSFGGGGASGSW